MKKNKKIIKERIYWKRFLKKNKRTLRIKKKERGELKYQLDILRYKEKHNKKLISSKKIRRGRHKIIEKKIPPFFTLKYEHCTEVIKFINELKVIGGKGRNININMTEAVELGEGAISMLLSIINEQAKKGIIIKGIKPNNLNLRHKLESSGFFKYLRTIMSLDNSKSKNKILRTGDSNTSKKDLALEVKLSMETVWGVPARCPELRGGVFEMFRNSCDHAFPNNGEVTWHLGLAHFDERNLVKFSFVDNGKGIIKTIEKPFFDKLISFFNNNAAFLEAAYLDGVESSTGLKWRGKGLPCIYELYKENIIKRLIVISNNVYLDFDRGIKKDLSVSFSGTYYYWELDKTCKPSYFL